MNGKLAGLYAACFVAAYYFCTQVCSAENTGDSQMKPDVLGEFVEPFPVRDRDTVVIYQFGKDIKIGVYTGDYAFVTTDKYVVLRWDGCLDGRPKSMLRFRLSELEFCNLMVEIDQVAGITVPLVERITASGPDDWGVFVRSSHGVEGVAHPTMLSKSVELQKFKTYFETLVLGYLERREAHCRMLRVAELKARFTSVAQVVLPCLAPALLILWLVVRRSTRRVVVFPEKSSGGTESDHDN